MAEGLDTRVWRMMRVMLPPDVHTLVRGDAHEQQRTNQKQNLNRIEKGSKDERHKEQAARLEQLGGEKRDIAFGSQIRSYVLHPYQLIKDHRTKEEVGDVNRVLDGDLDAFVKTYLMQKASGTLGSPAAGDED